MEHIDPEVAHRYLKQINDELASSTSRSSMSSSDAIATAKKLFNGKRPCLSDMSQLEDDLIPALKRLAISKENAS